MTVTCPRWFYQLFCYADNGWTSARPCTNCNASPRVHRPLAGTIRTKVVGLKLQMPNRIAYNESSLTILMSQCLNGGSNHVSWA